MFEEGSLSERQRQIIHLSAAGMTDKEIARKLGIGEGTLRTYWDRLRLRLEAQSRTEAVAKILQNRFDRLNARCDELLAILQTLPQFVWTATPSGYVDYCNDWFVHFGGLTPAECEGKGCRALMIVEELEDSATRWRNAQETGDPYEAKVRFRREDGELLWHQIRLFPLRSQTGEVYKWVGSGQQIELL